MPLINFRANDEDQRILKTLMKKLGLSAAAIIRQALRLLYRQEVEK